MFSCSYFSITQCIALQFTTAQPSIHARWAIHVYGVYNSLQKTLCNISCTAFFLLFHKRAERLVNFVNVRLRNHFVGSVHRDYRYADVHRVNVHVCNELRHRSAAANVHSAKLARLPNNAVIVEDLANFTHKFRACVRRAALAARALNFVKPAPQEI